MAGPRHWPYRLHLRLRSLFRRGQVESDLHDELRFHPAAGCETGQIWPVVHAFADRSR
jgi:hypothetical protein